MYDWNQPFPMPEAQQSGMQPFPLPNLAHPMNLPYPYPIPPGSKLLPEYPPRQPMMQPMQPMQMTQPMQPMTQQMQPMTQPSYQTYELPEEPTQPAFQKFPESSGQQLQQMMPESRRGLQFPQPQPMPFPQLPGRPPRPTPIRDLGPKPYVVDIDDATRQNDFFRITLWTGRHLQVTLMSIDPGEDIGVESHPHVDQFIRIEQGQGVVLIGDNKRDLNMQSRIKADDAIMIPAGKWHNIVNTGHRELKLYSIYAPVQHPHGTVHRTKADAITAEQIPPMPPRERERR